MLSCGFHLGLFHEINRALRKISTIYYDISTVNPLLVTAQMPEMITLHRCHNPMPLQEQEPREHDALGLIE